MSKKGKFTVILPMYNEEKTAKPMIKSLVKELDRHGNEYEILVINDGSKDDTSKKLRELKKRFENLRIITHETNLGLGAALESGFKNSNSEILITMDADLTQDPSYIMDMVKELENGSDVVIGSRYVGDGGMEGVPFYRVWESMIANFAFSIIFGINVRDMTSGFRCYRRSVVKNIDIDNKGFPSQLEILVKCDRLGAKIKEVPFVLRSREIGESKFNFFGDARNYFTSVIRMVFR